MATKIPWTDETWQPVVGCTKVSEGCTNCYAEKMACRLAYMDKGKYVTVTMDYRKPGVFDGWNSGIFCDESALDKPLHWKKPRRIFVCSMSDLFHPSVPFEFIDKVVDVFNKCPQHTGQILTKREKRLFEYSKYRDFKWPDNIIGMVTAENQKCADLRILPLLQCGFKTTGVSCEPMLGEIDLTGFKPWWGTFEENQQDKGLHQVIVGCESGPKRRECKMAWVGDLVGQCQAANVSVFVKQLQLPKVKPKWDIRSEIPSTIKPPLIAKAGKPYKAILNKHGALSARVNKELLGLKPDEYEIIGNWVSHKMEEWPEDLRIRNYPK